MTLTCICLYSHTTVDSNLTMGIRFRATIWVRAQPRVTLRRELVFEYASSYLLPKIRMKDSTSNRVVISTTLVAGVA